MTASVGRAKQEGSLLFFFPLSLFPSKSTGTQGLGCGGGGEQQILQPGLQAPWSRPGCSVGSISLFFALPETPVLIPVSWAGVGMEGSWVRLWGKRGRNGQSPDPLANCPEKSPNAVSGWKGKTVPGSLGTVDSLESKDLGWQNKGGQWSQWRGSGLGGRGEVLCESHKLETEGMSGHLHFLPL